MPVPPSRSHEPTHASAVSKRRLKCLQVGFPWRKPEKLVKALHHTHRIVWIRSMRKTRLSKAGQMLGFARATSDEALTATIWDVAVRPDGPST